MKKRRYFQWLEGEAIGTVSILDSITCIDGEYFYNFTDGESCNLRFISPMTNSRASIKNKIMVEVPNASDTWKVEEISTTTFKNAGDNEIVEVPPLGDIVQAKGQSCEIEESVLGKKTFSPPKFQGPFPELPSIEDWLQEELEVVKSPQEMKTPSIEVTNQPEKESFHEPLNISTPVTVTDLLPAEDEPVLYEYSTKPYGVEDNFSSRQVQSDPVEILVKNCKKHVTNISLDLEIQLPNKSVFDIANNEFEDGGDKFINYLIEGLEINDIIESLRDALKDAYLSKKEDDSQNS